MKNIKFLPFLGLTLCVWAVPSRVEAQTAAPDALNADTALAPALPAVSMDELSQLCRDGFYDEAIALATGPIEAAQASDPPEKVEPLLFYWRGLAELRVGWFGHAREDMSAASKAGVVAKIDSPQSVLQKIDQIEAVLPPQVHEVQNGGDTIFRVYYTQDDPVTQAIIGTLPAAYQISSDLLGADLLEQPVFIFNTFGQMTTFMQARGSKSATSWAWAYGGRDAFYFCLENPQGQPVASFQESYIRSTVAHEYNHALFRRAMGNVTIPNWFVEGMGVLAGSRIAREAESLNDYTVARLLVTNALVPPQNLEVQDAFNGHTEVSEAMRRAGLGKVAADPYAESFNMTRFLLSNMRADELPDFLNRVRESKSFEAGLQAQFGVALPEFYARWYAAVRQKMQ